MEGHFVTNLDIRTRFNPIFHSLKVRKIENDIEEMYHSATTITNFDYELGFLTTRSLSAEDVAISIIGKREHLEKQIERHERYLEIHDQAVEKVWKYENEILYFQSGLYSFKEVGAVFGVGKERIRQILLSYRKAVSNIMTSKEMDDNPISPAEIEFFGAIIERNVFYEQKLKDRSLDPLHGLSEWAKKDDIKRAERNKKRRAAETAV